MRLPLLYTDLASWWPIFSSPGDYAEEAGLYAAALERLAVRPIRTLLELGSGGGNNASHLKERYEMTLVDVSPAMLEVSRALNPECEHVGGDMRSVRLGRTFDAVLIHDAIMYMTAEADLAAALATAAVHLEPGGVGLFVPDDTVETHRPRTLSGGDDGEGRAVRYLEWASDPAPGQTWFSTVFVYVLAEDGAPIRVEHEEHRMGIYPRARWLALLDEAGFDARALPYEHSSFTDATREMFAGTRR